MEIVRVVLDESVAKSNVGAIAWDLQWSIAKVIKAEDNTPKQIIYYEEEAGQKTFIHFYEDFYIDLPYIEVYGKNPELISVVLQDIHDFLPTHTVPEIIEMVENATTREELFLAIRYLGIGCGGKPMTTELLELWGQLAKDSDSNVRETVIIAMGYTAAAEFKEILETLVQRDPVLKLRSLATNLLEGMKKYMKG